MFLLPREVRDLIRRWSEGARWCVNAQTDAQVVGERTPGAKALMSGSYCGTAEAVPFVKTRFSTEGPMDSG